MNLNPAQAIDFYVFSGTGNTLTVVKAMKEVFANNHIPVTLLPLEKADLSRVDCTHTLGIGVPVAMQGTYPIVWNFLKNLPACDGTDVFFVDTLMMYSGGIIGPSKSILEKKGYRTIGAKEILMPHNILVRKHDENKTASITEKGIEEAKAFASELISGTPTWKDIPVYSFLMSTFSRMGMTWKLFRKVLPLRVDNARCTRCGLCEKLCPTDNWHLDATTNTMQWSDGCIYCMRCFAHCPEHAIHYGSKKNIQYTAVKAADFLR